MWWLWMILGAVLGVLVAVQCAWLTVLIGAGLLSLVPTEGTNWIVSSCGFLLTGLGLLAVYGVAGYGSGGTVALMVRAGKVRDERLAGGAAVLSALLTIAGLHFAMTMIGADEFLYRLAAPIVSTSILGWLGRLLGVALALFVAGAYGTSIPKFCETCRRFMKERKLKPVSFDDLVRAVRALGDGDAQGAASIFQSAAKPAQAQGELAVCRKCGAGYLDMTLKFRGEWPIPGAALGSPRLGVAAESWLAVSRALAADQARWFKAES